MKIKNFNAVYPFEGYVIKTVNCQAIGIQVNLAWDRRRTLRCPDCGSPMRKNRETPLVAFDLPCGGGPVVYIKYPSIQGRCSSCDCYKTVRPAEIHPTKKATWRLMRYVSLLARYVPMSEMRTLLEVPQSTAYRYDRAVLEADLPEPDLDGIEAILVDEKQVRRGHGYVTLVLNANTGELLHLSEGKKKTSLESFFGRLSSDQKASIKAVGLDRGGAYRAAVEAHLPGAAIVFDKFHLVANLNAVMDELRREEYKKANTTDRGFIKGMRFNLFRHPENLSDAGAVKLAKLLGSNEVLNTAYFLKDQFRFVWSYSTPGWARRYLKRWIGWVRESGIQPLMRFAKGVERDMEQIVSWCKHRITNGRIEGFNSIVSRVVFKARGIRSPDYLFLKLRQESLLQS